MESASQENQPAKSGFHMGSENELVHWPEIYDHVEISLRPFFQMDKFQTIKVERRINSCEEERVHEDLFF